MRQVLPQTPLTTDLLRLHNTPWFPVGGTVPQGPFVAISQLGAHLRLLEGFRELKT